MKTPANRSTASAHSKHTGEARKGIWLFIVFSLLTLYSFSQNSAYLDFRNPATESGVPGTDGAKYRFSNVTNQVDAIVTIMGRSDGLVNILNPDMNTSGFDGAFQPQVGYNNGTAPGPADWWMEFNIEFVATGTTTPIVIEDFNVSGVDIDGNSQYINEYLSFFGMQDYSIETGSGLSVISLYENINGSMLSGKRFDGPVANYTNIDTSATSVMVTNHYVNKSSFTVRTGGRSSDVSGAADRMYSFYFQNFSYNTPYNAILAMQTARVRPVRNNDATTIFSAYPNPVNGSLNIKVPQQYKKENCSIRLYDIKGNLISNSADRSFESTQQLDMGSMKAGIYLLQVIAGNEKFTQRIVKM